VAHSFASVHAGTRGSIEVDVMFAEM